MCCQANWSEGCEKGPLAFSICSMVIWRLLSFCAHEREKRALVEGVCTIFGENGFNFFTFLFVLALF